MNPSLTLSALTFFLLLAPMVTTWAQGESAPFKEGPHSAAGREERPRRLDRENRKAAPPGVDRYLHYLRKNNPEEFERMRALKEEDPTAFRQELRQKVMNRRKEMAQKHSRGAFREELNAIRQATSPEAKQQAIDALRANVSTQVEASLKRREERMQQVRAQLTQLEERHARELEQKSELIDRHVEKLMEKLESSKPAANNEGHGTNDSQPVP